MVSLSTKKSVWKSLQFFLESFTSFSRLFMLKYSRRTFLGYFNLNSSSICKSDFKGFGEVYAYASIWMMLKHIRKLIYTTNKIIGQYLLMLKYICLNNTGINDIGIDMEGWISFQNLTNCLILKVIIILVEFIIYLVVDYYNLKDPSVQSLETSYKSEITLEIQQLNFIS